MDREKEREELADRCRELRPLLGLCQLDAIPLHGDRGLDALHAGDLGADDLRLELRLDLCGVGSSSS
jgi:hypothetical protein